MMFTKRKISQVYNMVTAQTVTDSEILDKISDPDEYVLIRRNVRKRNRRNDPLYVCDKCGTPLELSCMPNADGGHTYFFRHIKDPENERCPFKTNTNLTKEEILRSQYEFKRESLLHKELKARISDVIREFIDPEVVTDSKYIKDKFGIEERRRPDVFFNFNGRELAIEIQLNNTFHTVIEEREAFYERNGISLIWVFKEFDPNSFNSITTKDIYVPNFNNAFVFNDEVLMQSLKRKTLCFNAHFKFYRLRGSTEVYNEWQEETIELSQLKFSNQTLRPYFHDSPQHKIEAEEELSELRRIRSNERQQHEAELKSNEFKLMLSKFKLDDSIPTAPLYGALRNLEEEELITLNHLLDLRSFRQDGKDIIQLLINPKKPNSHNNLIQFLLKAKSIDIYLNYKSDELESTLTTILRSSEFFKYDIIKFLFLRKYQISDSDISFIKSTMSLFEANRTIQKFKYYQLAFSESQIDSINDFENELYIIECAKGKHQSLLGNGVQGILWMANLAANQYVRHWKYFDLAFKYYRFYSEVSKKDLKGTFKDRGKELNHCHFELDPRFEIILKLLFPELAPELKVSGFDF